MFEGIVSDLLNRILGMYIENLDCSKLKISIWGGDVELKDLVIKQSALDELQLPIRPVFGHLERLILKIPWTKLYTERWEATLEGLLLVVVPNTSIAYDFEKEEQLLLETKLATLSRIEEAKQRTKLKNLGETKNQDGFIEKLVAQVIRNIQVKFKSIHIRYEDSITYPLRPFAAGFSLLTLSLQSTDCNWEVGLDTAKLIYKLLSLEGFLIYWSSDCTLLSQLDISRDEILRTLSDFTTSASPINLIFNSSKPVLGPVNLSAKLQLNTKPELDDIPYSLPKAVLNIVLEKLSIEISHFQYADMMNLLNSLERMKLSSNFRKYRPNVETVTGYAVLWWKYAYKCKLENIQRIQRNWSWQHMKEHRGRCKLYKTLHKLKLKGSKLTGQQMQNYDDCEIFLDVFNITLIRRQSEMELEREGQFKAEAQQKKGWFGGWLSWGNQSEGSVIRDDASDNIAKRLEAAMDANEKQKLYEAIGYSEGGVPNEMPIEFTDIFCKFLLEELLLSISDDLLPSKTICVASLSKVICSLNKRTAAAAIKFESSIQSLTVKGIPGVEGVQPNLVESLYVSEEVPLLYVMAETNPLDGECDTRIEILMQPLNIIYHAVTIAHSTDFFTLPDNISLQQLQAAALARLEVVKEKSVTGLQAAIDNHSILDLNIKIKASRLILPQNGYYDVNLCMIVMTLGSVDIVSNNLLRFQKNLVHLSSNESMPEKVLETMRSSSYDCFSINLKDVQIVIVGAKENWQHAITSFESTDMHLLKPLSLNIEVLKCLITNDPSLPKIKISATLPKMAFSIVDSKIIEAAIVVENCFNPVYSSQSGNDEISIMEENDFNHNVIAEEIALARLNNTEFSLEKNHSAPQFTEFIVNFTIGDVIIDVLKTQQKKPSVNLLKLNAKETSFMIKKKTFDMNFTLTLLQLDVDHLEWGVNHIIKTQSDMNDTNSLFKIKYIQVNPKNPDIHTVHSSIIEQGDIEMSSVTAKLEQKTLLSLLSFISNMQDKLKDVKPITTDLKNESFENEDLDNKKKTKEKVFLSRNVISKDHHQKPALLLKKYSAKMGELNLTVSQLEEDLLTLKIKGMSVEVMLKKQNIYICSFLQEFSIFDPKPEALHRNIIIMEGDRVWNANIAIFEQSSDELDFFNVNKYDISIDLELGTPRIVFLQKTVTSIMSWISNFQVAMDAIVSASQAAARAAKSNIQEVFSQCLKVKMSLVLKAPVICVPLNSTTCQGLLLDLGKMTICNEFISGSTRNELGHPCIFDKLCISIDDVKLSRKQDFQDTEEIQLLVPFSLTLDVVRNLSISWYKSEPEMKVNARLKAIKVHLSEEDISSAFAIVFGNLRETYDETALIESSSHEAVAAATSIREREQQLAESGITFKRVSLQFVIENISLNLFLPPDTTSNSPLMQEGSSQTRLFAHHDSDKSFSSCCLEGLTLKLDLFSNQNISANLILFNCIIEDTRKDFQSGITKILEKKETASEKMLPVIDLTFHQNSKNDIFVDLKICEFLLVLHLPFLLDLQKFINVEATQDMTQEDENEECENPHYAPPLLTTQTSSIKTSQCNKMKKPPAKEKSIEDDLVCHESLITIYVKIEQPDIVLVENLDSIDTSCIFLHTEIQCNVKLSPSQRHITANANNVQMYTCCFNPVKRKGTLSQILTRSEINFICNSTSNVSENIQISIGSLNFRLAPDTVELFMSIISCLSSTKEKVVPKNEVQNWNGLWEAKPINFSALPNLQIDDAQEAVSVEPLKKSGSSSTLSSKNFQKDGAEKLCMEIDCLLVTLEAGSGYTSIPLLKLQSGCLVIAEGFYSSLLSFNGHLSLELAYYNPRQAIWEPLLEPVEKLNSQGIAEHQSWSLTFEGTMEMYPNKNQIVRMTALTPTSPVSEDGEMIEIETPSPKAKLAILATDPLEIVFTKTFLEVSNILSLAFLEAYEGTLSIRHTPRAPYKLNNKTGLNIIVGLKASGLWVAKLEKKETEDILVEPDCEVELFESLNLGIMHRRHSSLVAECQIATEKFINILIPDVDASCLVPVTKADKHYFSLSPKGKFKDKFGLVTIVTVKEGCKSITLSSCVKVRNELNVEVDIYYMTENGNEVEFVCSLLPLEESYLSLKAIYTPTSEIFFSVKGYSVCINPLVWKRLQNYPNLIQELHCQPRNKDVLASQPPYIFCAVCEVEQIFWGNTNRRTIHSILAQVNLRPCSLLNNFLPFAISITPPGVTEKSIVLPGVPFQITHAQIGNSYFEIKILNYRGSDWIGSRTIEPQVPELSVLTFYKQDSKSEITLDLGMHINSIQGMQHINLYCPFWMVNKTGYNITYKNDNLVHSIQHFKDDKETVLFSFRSKAFFGKKKTNLKLDGGDWSEKFPLDTVGSSGSVTCRTNGILHQVSVDIQLACSGLTKIVTFSSFYKVINHCPYIIEYSFPDDPLSSWNVLIPGECSGIWPPGPSKAFILRIINTVEKTLLIHFDAQHTTLFKLKNKFGGIFVEVTVTEGGTIISLDRCMEGATTALVLNHLGSSSVTFWQEGHEDKKMELGPQQMVHFSWDSAESRHLLMLSIMGCEPITIALNADARGVIDNGVAGWATWLSGPQRYVVISNDMNLLENPSNSRELDRLDQEIDISFSSIGFSLVNDVLPQEIMYLCMASSGVVWEHRKEKGKKYRPFTETQTILLEKVYLMHIAQVKTMQENVKSRYLISSNLEVDFSLMQSFQPFQRNIRRTFQPGVSIQLQNLASQWNFHMKVNKIQLDNQMSDVIFPVILARIPPSRGVLAETVPKPFFELSIIMTLDSPIFRQFKYFQMLIQEFHIKIELPFLFAIMETIFPEQRRDVKYSVEIYEKDSSVIYQSLTEMVAAQRHPSRRDFYHHLHLSPIKMHLSFSLTGLEAGSKMLIGGQIIHLFLQSVGLTLTEVQDVIFRLGFFERQNCWLNMEGFQNEVISHYQNQLMKQLYVLILGLDVLGNPFGLVLGMTKGFGDLFYEPIQGAIEGPGEFAEGLAYGARSFLGKTVGGAAGAFSRITGTIGKGVASLTLDDDYQQKRREEMHKKPADSLEIFARGSKGVLTGVVDGVAGVFLKPISGAKEEGVEGFFKGVGKGMVGLVTRPASGVIDFASGSLDLVMRTTDSNEEIVPVRPPRFIATDGIIRPYDFKSSSGNKLLKELEKGRYADTDSYVVHCRVKGTQSVLLGTDKRVILVFRNDLLGQWKMEWAFSYEELAEPPLIISSAVKLTVRAVKRKVLAVFGGGDNSKEVILHDPRENKFVVERLAEAYNKATQLN